MAGCEVAAQQAGARTRRSRSQRASRTELGYATGPTWLANLLELWPDTSLAPASAAAGPLGRAGGVAARVAHAELVIIEIAERLAAASGPRRHRADGCARGRASLRV